MRKCQALVGKILQMQKKRCVAKAFTRWRVCKTRLFRPPVILFLTARSFIWAQIPASEKARPTFWTQRPILAIIEQDCCLS
jgi:hypothetical protein